MSAGSSAGPSITMPIKVLRFGSVCSGIEAASAAWGPLGWQAAWFSEIEPFPSAVLAHHYPDVPNLGDMTTLPDRIASGEVEAPDVFCGGTPCQAFSVAGLRKSLGDARGNLSLTFCEIANAIDDARHVRGEPATIVFWENVPGVLSTSDNAFGCFLAALVGGDEPLNAPDGWPNAGCVDGPQRSAAWRVLDAQYFGVAQRRRRVFVVASARDDFDPAAVLFEWDGVRRDSAPSRKTGKAVAPTTRAGAAISDYDVAGTLDKGVPGRGIGHNGNYDSQVVPMLFPHGVLAFGGNRTSGSIDISPALLTQPGSGWKGDFESEAFLVQPTHTLRGEGFDAREDGTGWGTPPIPVGVTIHGTDPTVQKVASYDELAQCLRARTPGNIDNSSTTVVQQPVQPYTLAIRGRGDTHQLEYRQDGTANALLTPNGGRGGIGVGAIAFDTTQITSPLNRSVPKPGDPCHPLAAGAHAPAIAFHPTQDPISSADVCHSIGANANATAAIAFTQNQRDEVRTLEVSGALPAEPGMKQQTFLAQAIGWDEELNASTEQSGTLLRGGQGGRHDGVMTTAMQVRRLTPVECERLQGFPDGWTRIPSWSGWRKMGEDETPEQCFADGLEVRQNKKTGAWRVKDVDGPRYKALGNSWAVPVVRWIGRRIEQALRAEGGA
jgi:DNA (cytosine-5)-methyltransferase 1